MSFLSQHSEQILSAYDSLVASDVSDSEFRSEFKKLLENHDDPRVVTKENKSRAKAKTPNPASLRGAYKKIPEGTPLSFTPVPNKRGKAAERYEVYKEAKTVGEYKQLNATPGQQKDFEHAIVHKLVEIDTSSFGEDDSCALSWINKFLEKSTEVKEKKSPKKTPPPPPSSMPPPPPPPPVEEPDVSCTRTSSKATPVTHDDIAAMQVWMSALTEEPAEEATEEATEETDEEFEVEEYHVRGDSGVRGREVHPFYIDRKTNKVYQKKPQRGLAGLIEAEYIEVGDIHSHPEDEEE